MAASDLYKMGRVMNLEPFVTRVKAAVLLHASSMALGGTASTEKNFAIWVLKNPMADEPSMTALVASDPAVLSQVTLEGDLANVDAVTDASIKSVIAARWSLVSTKYPLGNPTPQAP